VKTPREILLHHHRDAQPKLDTIRRAVLATKTERGNESISLREMLRSLRWHLLGMSAVWFVVLILHSDAGSAPLLAAATPKPPPPQVVIASMREHRRLLSEMADAQPIEGEQRELFVPKPHSECRREFSIA
jgi:hypothetical protein